MHYLRNFKSFADASIDLMRPMTLLIGRNGSGKSNAIEGVELLAQLAHGLPLFNVTDVGRGVAGSFEIRGGLVGCVRHGEPSECFELGFDAAYRFDGTTQPFSYRLTVNAGILGNWVESEQLKINDRILFSARCGGSKDILDVTYDNFARGGTKPTTHLAADRSVLSRYGVFAPSPDPKKPRTRDAHNLVRAVEQHLNAAFVFDPHPRSMRDYARIGQSRLAKDGGNLSSVLHALKIGDDDARNKLSRIKARISNLPEEPFEDFEFFTTPLNDVMMALKTKTGEVTDARQLSDGTLRALAILTAVETVPEYSRIVIEEIDNGIHSSRLDALVDALWESAGGRKLNVLATTHNPATLDCLDDEQLRSVVIAYFNQTTSSAELKQLLDLPRVESLLEPGLLGGLVTRRTLDRFLGSDAEEKQQGRMREWLASIE